MKYIRIDVTFIEEGMNKKVTRIIDSAPVTIQEFKTKFDLWINDEILVNDDVQVKIPGTSD